MVSSATFYKLHQNLLPKPLLSGTHCHQRSSLFLQQQLLLLLFNSNNYFNKNHKIIPSLYTLTPVPTLRALSTVASSSTMVKAIRVHQLGGPEVHFILPFVFSWSSFCQEHTTYCDTYILKLEVIESVWWAFVLEFGC